MDGPDDVIALLDVYLAGTGTPEERARAIAYVDARPHLRARLDALRHRVDGDMPNPIVYETIRVQLLERVARDVAGPERKTRPVSPPNIGRPWRMVGLGILAILGSVGLMRYMSHQATRTSVHVYRTAAGRVANLVLPSGVHLVLGPATTVTVAVRPDHSTQVAVQGNVLAAVPPNAHVPFTVRAGNSITRVLGTTFAVRKYATDRVVRIAVLEGRVAVHALVPHDGDVSTAQDGADAVLAAKTLGMVTDSGVVQIMPNAPVNDMVAWAQGRLVFHQTPLRDVIPELERAYDVEIHLADSSLANHALTFTVLTSARSVDDVLHALVPALDAHYARSGRTIFIRHGRSSAATPSSPVVKETHYGR